MEKLIGRINGSAFEGWLDRWGGKALFVIRAIPGTPSDFISYLAGLTNMRRRTYVLATFLGYIPQSLLFAWLGDTAMGWFWWIVMAGFAVSALIGLAGWAIQRRSNEAGRRRIRPRASATCI
ncbi:MAG TPA: VTT domain-containing protein [Thermomicrobiales bacterium]|nr:VTT domain-containing protein [Thermomicrobiales bacterium]